MVRVEQIVEAKQITASPVSLQDLEKFGEILPSISEISFLSGLHNKLVPVSLIGELLEEEPVEQTESTEPENS